MLIIGGVDDEEGNDEDGDDTDDDVDVDPSHPVLYRSGLVFERVTAGQARAGCGSQNG
ncbi:hypothetical protein F2Q68_00004235 [Brassica cretica]|uniref:Uncharacterized protein n=1 Tax=Brassica cretica TaxID=69181 RepID=A0A8S9JJW4_BRACR|nr:hypothetical protein F2Q68_00004235 [Brassica cretica]